MDGGHAWRNTEDEILKAAVMKYGTNQWARISSLLTRRTPKQCKARWFEWLDPSVRKVEWSADEDANLLHLVKLMPTQWRTIAVSVGRTAAQCLERYNQLADLAQSQSQAQTQGVGSSGDTKGSGSAVRHQALAAENKPARPDPVDMDDDEMEMLAEARARLANTQGKKAKRKARERQLEEAKRLALLQKQRELKQAGIDIDHKRKAKKVKGVDFSEVIPYEKLVPEGVHDITEEDAREERERKTFTATLLQKMEGKRKADIEESQRKKDAKKIKKQQDEGTYIPANLRKIQQDFEASKTTVSERRPLNLPKPIISSEDIDDDANGGDMDISFDDELERQFHVNSHHGGSATNVTNGMPLTTTVTTRQRNNLKSLFGALPKPKNDFEIVAPGESEDEDEEEEEEDEEDYNFLDADEEEAEQEENANPEIPKNSFISHVKDAGEIERLRAEDIRRKEELNLMKRSSAMQRKLPIPDVVPDEILKVVTDLLETDNNDTLNEDLETVFFNLPRKTPETTTKKRRGSKPKAKDNEAALDSNYAKVDSLIQKELCMLVAHDVLQNTIKASKSANGVHPVSEMSTEQLSLLTRNASTYESHIKKDITIASLTEAEKLIVAEEAALDDSKREEIESSYKEWAEKNIEATYQTDEYYESEWKQLRKIMMVKAQAAAKLEKKISIKIGGYKNIMNQVGRKD